MINISNNCQSRFFVTYQPPTPVITVSLSRRILSIYKRRAIQIEILPSGEEGPRRIDNSTAMFIRGIPFLNITEYSRAKLRAWVTYVPQILLRSTPHIFFSSSSRANEQDAADLVFVMNRYWHRVNINRIPESDMDRFVTRYPAAAPSWQSLKDQYESD